MKDYQHVQSKVKQYIKEIKETDEAARERRRVDRLKVITNAENFNIAHVENSNSKPSDEEYEELLKKYNDLKDENIFLHIVLKTCDKVDINECTEISLVSNSDFGPTCFESTICSEDFSISAPPINNNVRCNGSSGMPLLHPDCKVDSPRTKRKSLIALGKKVLRKFACAEKVEKPNNATFQLHPLNTMRRIYTPKQKHFGRGINNTSTPGGDLQRRVFRSARKASPAERRARVAFHEDNGTEDRSAQAKRFIENLDDLKGFLNTL